MQKDQQAKNKNNIKIGDRVIVKGEHKGIVKYIGALTDDVLSPPTYVGIQLDEHVGTPHNGLYKGKRYFHCPPGHGMMVKYNQVSKISAPEKKPPLKGNTMFPSYQEIRASRKERSEKDPSWNLGPPYNNKPKSEPQHVDKSDSKDIAVKDAKKRENQRRQQISKEVSQLQAKPSAREDQPEKELNKWKHKFGGDKRAEYMARTLQKLHLAYEEGIDYKRREDGGGDTTDQDADDEESVVDGHHGSNRKKVVRIRRPASDYQEY